jgi:hypothetical protein
MPTTQDQKERDERAALTDDEWGRYEEAIKCGACHETAMEAATC